MSIAPAGKSNETTSCGRARMIFLAPLSPLSRNRSEKQDRSKRAGIPRVQAQLDDLSENCFGFPKRVEPPAARTTAATLIKSLRRFSADGGCGCVRITPAFTKETARPIG